MATDQNYQSDLEDFLALTNSAIAYLKYERFQESLINNSSGISTVLAILTDSHTRFGISNNYNAPNFVQIDADDAVLLSKMRFQLTSVLSDISALPSFSAAYPLGSPVSNSLIQLISTSDSAQSKPQLVTAACIILGNLARTEIACQTLVYTYAIHIPLTAILSSASRSVDGSTPISSQQTQLSYAVLGLLRNLAIPASNKEYLGDAGILESALLPRLWSLESSPQIQYTSINLTRQIVTGCLPNIKRLCQPLSPDPDSPASGKSSLHILLDLYKRASDADAATMTEISRIVTAVCRVLHITTSGTEMAPIIPLRQKFYDMHSTEIVAPLNYLITQGQAQIFSPTSLTSPSTPPKHPILRSEGWFVLALMAGTPEGSKVVANCMHDTDVFSLTCEILSGKRWEDGGAFSKAIENSDATGTIENSRPEQETTSTSTSNIADTAMLESPQAVLASGSGQNASAKQKAADRSNVLVMVSELLKHHGEEMASFRRAVFEDLVRIGGKGVASEAVILNR